MAEFNPFAGLDKSRFPKGEDASGKDRRKTPKVKIQQVAKNLDPEDEEALFLNAVGSVRPLSGETDAADAGQTMEQALAAEEKSDGKAGVNPGLNRLSLPRKSKKTSPVSSPADSAPASATTLASDFAALVNLTLPSAANDKRPALFREQPQSRRESARERSRDAVIHAQDAAQDAKIARLASPDVDDPDVFIDAMRAVTPISAFSTKGREVNPDAPPPPVSLMPEDNPMQDFMDGKLEFSLASTDEYVEGHVVGLDLMLVSKLQNGQFSPEGHLDLHGLNTVQAFQTLVGFMRGAYMKGQRTVLVVPGRGKNSPLGVGVLREKIQEWLTQEPFRRVILAFCTARSVDGGTGAMYVLLRKLKKSNGKVYWERRPTDPDLIL